MTRLVSLYKTDLIAGEYFNFLHEQNLSFIHYE